MSQAEALLNSLAETVDVHKHIVPDSDTHFVIDPYTRQIENTNYKKTVLMRGDHNSERFTFEIPRYVDGHDMSLCNRVIVHFDNVGDSIENVYSDVAYMDDLSINPDNPDTVISSWLIRREATQIVGILSFSLQYQCVENEEITYEWNTDSYDGIEIRKSKNNGEAAVIQYTNVLEQWRSQIFGAGDSVMANITTEGANQVTAVQNESATQQAAIELKGSETLATIPEDYTEVYNMAEEALRTKADGVVCEAEGETITVNDSSDDYIRGLKVYGTSIQDGTPTPDAPVEIVSVENPTVYICGCNLIDDTSLVGKDVSSASETISVHLVPGTYTASITITGNDTEKDATLFFYTSSNKRVAEFNTQKNEVFIIPEDVHYVNIHPFSGATGGTWESIAIHVAGYTTDDCNYSEPQTLAINRTLPGIPVTTGGNYTDENGQQWICDEIDFERGVYVQRLLYKLLDDFNTATLDSSGNGFTEGHIDVGTKLATRGLCDSFPYKGAGNELRFAGAGNCAYFTIPGELTLDEWKARMTEISPKVLLVLADPIETPLTAEEITAFKTLRTNYPNTTILNDAGAWMSVKYNADTKSYVDKPKTLRLTDSSTGVVYELKIVDGNITVVPV